MTRKEFLKKIGFGIIALVATPKIIDLNTEPSSWYLQQEIEVKEKWESVYIDGITLHRRQWPILKK